MNEAATYMSFFIPLKVLGYGLRFSATRI